jgi:quinol monooxygenase YgiN
MSIRLVSQGKISDYEKYATYLSKWDEHVQQSSGVVRVEGWADRESGTVHFDEEWADGDALMAHVAGMQESGLLDEMLSLQTIDTLTLLTPTDHAGVLALCDQFGATHVAPVVSVVR